MNQEKAKQAVELAEKELQEEEEKKQVELIKKAIKQTLEKIREKEKNRNQLSKEIKILRQDMDNIKNGRLDLIAERQEKDEEAKKTSIIEVVKEKEVHYHHYYNRWYEPYKIAISSVWETTGVDNYYTTGNDWTTMTNCSIAKNSWAGTYKLECGDCVTLT